MTFLTLSPREEYSPTLEGIFTGKKLQKKVPKKNMNFHAILHYSYHAVKLVMLTGLIQQISTDA